MKKVMNDILLTLMFNILKNHLRMKLGKIENLLTNLHNKTEYVTHIRNLKQALNHGLILKKVIKE